MEKVYTQHWIDLPKEVRAHLSNVFSVTRTGLTEVRDQTLISDGTTNDDLARSFTLATLKAYVGKEDTFPHLWMAAVKKATNEVFPPIVEATKGKSVTFDMNSIVVAPSELQQAKDILESAVPFCLYCESKGVRHKSDCTNPNVKDGFEVKND